MEQLTKGNLVKRFDVEAGFYQVTTAGESFTCRNRAILKRKNAVRANKYDAILILVNPGSCKAMDEHYTIPTIDPRNYNAIPLIQAKSDPTQWQVMRLMELRKWNNVIMINLSDLCSGNMNIFKKNLQKIATLSYTDHSIFSENRCHTELKEILDRNEGPLILGWGTNAVIRELAKHVLASLTTIHKIKSREVVGWKHHTHPYYYHPKQHGNLAQEWLRLISEQLNETKEGEDET